MDLRNPLIHQPKHKVRQAYRSLSPHVLDVWGFWGKDLPRKVAGAASILVIIVTASDSVLGHATSSQKVNILCMTTNSIATPPSTIYGILELNGMSAPTWLQFTGQQPKRKRAELACVVCHGKKVRSIPYYSTVAPHTKTSRVDQMRPPSPRWSGV